MRGGGAKYSEHFVVTIKVSAEHKVSTIPLKSPKLIIIVEQFAAVGKNEDFARAKGLKAI